VQPTRPFSCLPVVVLPSLCHRPPCESLPLVFSLPYVTSLAPAIFAVDNQRTQTKWQGRSPLSVERGRRTPAPRTHHMLLFVSFSPSPLSCTCTPFLYGLLIRPFIYLFFLFFSQFKSMFFVSMTRLCEKWDMGKGRVAACVGGYRK
jgi:hypothetical protein